MDFVVELVKYGVVGLMAAIFFWMYQQEKKDHQKTRDALTTSYQLRLDDSEKRLETVNALASSTISAVQLLGTKIENREHA